MIAALALIFAPPAGFLVHAKGILHSDSNHSLYHCAFILKQRTANPHNFLLLIPKHFVCFCFVVKHGIGIERDVKVDRPSNLLLFPLNLLLIFKE